MKLLIYSVLSLLLLANCTPNTANNSGFQCNKCSEIESLEFDRLSGNKFSFNLTYPVGYGSAEIFEPHIELNTFLIANNDSIFVIKDSIKTNSKGLLWVLNEKVAISSSFTVILNDGRKVISRLDSLFENNQRLIFCYRLSNLSTWPMHTTLGEDLVLFISKQKGVEGMHLSTTGDELFDSTLKEIVHYPYGNVFYKLSQDSTKIVDFPDKQKNR